MSKGLGLSFNGPAQKIAALEEAAAIVSLFFALGSINSGPSPEQKASMQAEEDRRKAASALEDAQRLEAAAEEDRRRAYFAAPAPAY